LAGRKAYREGLLAAILQKETTMKTGLNHRAVGHRDPRTNLPPCSGIEQAPGRKPRFAPHMSKQYKKGNIKWLPPFQTLVASNIIRR
jgi:hypothetical protein